MSVARRVDDLARPLLLACVDVAHPLIRQDLVPQAVRALHAAFELGEGGIEVEEGPR